MASTHSKALDTVLKELRRSVVALQLRWIYPIIRGLCKELAAPAAEPLIWAGVTTILALPSPPSSNDGENQKEDKKDKILALITAVYIFVRTKLSGREIRGEEYVSQRKGVLSTLAKLRGVE
jgi:hypothetical protein